MYPTRKLKNQGSCHCASLLILLLTYCLAISVILQKFISELEFELIIDLTMHNAIQYITRISSLNTLTLFTAPEAPVNLQAMEKTPHALNLTWGHPNITNGRLRRFEVQVKLVSSKLRKQEGEIKIPEHRLEMNNTKTSKVYSYKVSEFWNLNFL
jgi:hypothetical protein